MADYLLFIPGMWLGKARWHLTNGALKDPQSK